MSRARFVYFRDSVSLEKANRKHARNEAMKEHDHAPLREAICAVVRETGLEVLVCPEDMSQMAVGKAMLVDKLPEDVRYDCGHKNDAFLSETLAPYFEYVPVCPEVG